MAGTATSIIFVATNKNMLVAIKLCLSRQTCVFRGKCFIVTNTCCNKNNFVATNVLSPQANTSFVATKICLSRENLSQQNYVCRDQSMLVCLDKIFLSPQNFCREKHTFVATKHVFVSTRLLSRQKLYFWQLPPMIERERKKSGHWKLVFG